MFEVAGVVARLGFLYDKEGAIQFERGVRGARDLSRRPIEVPLGARTDLVGFERYQAKLKQTQERVAMRGAYTAHLGADFNPVAFNKMYTELGKTKTAVAATSAETARFGGRLRGMAGNMVRTTAQMATMGIGFIGLAEAMKKSVESSIEFERQMELVHTQAGATQGEVKALGTEVLNLATKSAQGPIELSKGLFHLESVGLRGKAAMDALATASRGAAVGQADLEDTTTALGSAWLVNIKGAGNLDHVMALLNATVGAGNVRMGQLVEALGTGILPASKEAGLSIKDVFGAMAVFTDEGYKASSAAAQFSTALHFLYNPTLKASNALSGIGLASDQLAKDMHKKDGLLIALGDLKKHLERRFPDINLIAGLKQMGISASDFAKEMAQPHGATRAMYDLEGGLTKLGKTSHEQAGILSDMLDQFGISTVDAAQLITKPGGLVHAVQLMKQELGTSNRDIVAQEQILGNILPGGRGRIMLTLLNQLDRYQMKLNQIQHGTKNFADDVTKTQETSSFKLKNAWAQVEVALVRVGDRITPTIVSLATHFATFINQMRTGEGAGGSFARTAENVGKAIEVTGGILAKNISLVKSAAIAWLGYRTAVKLATSAAAVGGLRVVEGRIVGGVAAGAAAGGAARGAAAAGGTGLGVGLFSMAGLAATFRAFIGRVPAIAAAVGIADVLSSKGDLYQRLQKTLHDMSFGLIPAPKVRNETLEWFKTATGQVRLLSEHHDVTGLKNQATYLHRAAEEARGYGHDGQKAADAQTKLANAAEGLARRISALHGILHNNRVKATDVIDPSAAEQVAANMNSIRKYGINNIDDLRKRLQFNMKEIKKAFADGSQGAADAMAQNIRTGISALRRGMKDGTISTNSGMKEIVRLVHQNMTVARDDMKNLSASGKERLAQNFRDAASAVKAQMERAGKVTQAGMDQIHTYLAQALQVYGFSLKEAKNIVKGNSFTGGPDEGTRGPGKAVGGRFRAIGGVPNPHAGSSDDHVLLDPSGRPMALMSGSEGILNKPQMGVVDYALGGMAAMGMLPKSMGGLDALWGSGMRHYAGGGGLQPGVAAAVSAIEKRWPGYSVTSGYRTSMPLGHPDLHNVGEAADLVGPDMDRVGSWIGQTMGSSLAEGIHNPTLSIKNGKRVPAGFWGSSTWAAHANHIHVAVVGALGRLASALGGAGSIPSPKVVGGGAVGKAVGAALKMSAAAANQLLGNVAGVGGGDTTDISISGSASANRALGRKMMLGYWNGSQWPSLDRLWTKESGWSATAQNKSSGAAGIPQDITGNFHGGARGQIAWGLNYIKSRYGNPAKAWAHEQAFNWYRRGGRLRDGLRRFNGGGNIATGVGSTKKGAHTISRPTLSKKQNRGITRSLARGEAGIKDFEGNIQREERRYDQMDTEFGISNEVLTIENDDGSISVDTGMVSQRVGEIDALVTERKKIRQMYLDYVKAVKRLIESLKRAIDKLKTALNMAKGKSRAKERQGYRDAITTHQTRIGELNDVLSNLGLDVEDQRIDLEELAGERATVAGTKGEAAPSSSSSGSSGLTPDQQAALDQATSNQAIVARGTYIENAAAAILGPGAVPGGNPNVVGQAASYSPALQAKAAAMGVDLSAPVSAAAAPSGGATFIQNNYMLKSSDPAVLTEIAKASNAGNTYLGTVNTPRKNLGI